MTRLVGRTISGLQFSFSRMPRSGRDPASPGLLGPVQWIINFGTQRLYPGTPPCCCCAQRLLSPEERGRKGLHV